MQDSHGQITARTDVYTRVCLTVIAILLTVLIVGMWGGAPVGLSEQSIAATPSAGSGRTILPNAVRQRLDMIKGIQATNARLDKITALLKSGDVRVMVVQSDGAEAKKVNDNVNQSK